MILTLAGVIVVCVMLWLWVELLLIWRNDIPTSTTRTIRIKYRDFVKYYRIKPDRYFLQKGHVSVEIPHRSIYVLTFSFFDWMRYKCFCKSEERVRTKRTQREAMELYLKMVLQDIDSVKALAEKEIARGVEMIEQIHI